MQGVSQKRDLVGYGGTPPAWKLPGGARLAVSMVVNFEEGAELAVSDGDPQAEKISEVVSVVPPGRWDQGNEQIFAYGMRAGIWRMLAALDKHRMPATFYMCGRAVERLPHLARRIVEAGHEAACHGWLWRAHAEYADRESELADLRRCVDVMKSATGQRPAGFFCRGSESRETRSILRELGFFYASNGFDDDLPYWDRTDARRPLLVVPYALDSNDMKFFHPNGFVRADEMVDYVRDAIETLMEEGEAGHPKLLNIGWHLRIAGRPGRFAAFKRVLTLLESYGSKVWIARRDDIAQSWREQFPA
ncbi:MAG: polysaccharide deacetylase [Reyranella sp.]|uniref:polysaccharide deacetylase family protein n=1 Tax=Reyranella sp. TaxID=1929291 RepID=UPI00121D3A05|nr:polysaccharide deacetylase family protein [Reyranella sp.]TAJ89081.1 MAG: polysaccharide deacetylase [Reyranella sp.]TBR26682.1 MAG: polysaccharide deacetylase [Reyranella sp.]